jgi:hypothetical protein
MARSIDDIRSEIDGAISQEATLQGLSTDLSTSRVSIWRLWRNVVAAAIFTLEKLFEMHKVEVSKLSEKLIYGKEDWYQAQAFLWQVGDSLSVIDGKAIYVPIDLQKRIITRCSVKTQLGTVVLKVAKGEGNGLQPLDTDEKSAFEFYLDRIKPAGIRTEVVSMGADILWPEIKIYFRGELASGLLKARCIEAMNQYLAEIEFDGVFLITKLIDAIQAVDGVVDVEVTQIRVKSQIDNSYRQVIRRHESIGGYFQFDPDRPLTEAAQVLMIPQ